MPDPKLPQVRACGVLLYKDTPRRMVLLMRHPDRWDIPKGHLDEGEDDLTCALRETEEETGIPRAQIKLDPDFRFTQVYYPRYKRFHFQPVEKTLVVYLGRVPTDAEVVPTEHEGFEWLAWAPPHQIQQNTIDPLLAAVAAHWGPPTAADK